MENITSELDKVISYTLGRDVITEEDIDAVCITCLLYTSAPTCSGISKNTSGILCRRTPKPE